MKLLRGCLLLILFTGVAHADAAHSRSDEAGFGKRTTQLFDAMKAHDVVAVDALLGPHFVFTAFNGATGTRAQFIDVIAKKLMTIDSYKLEPVAVQVEGATAVVIYRLSIAAHVGDHAWPALLVSTDTWSNQGGTWKLLARHSAVPATQ